MKRVVIESPYNGETQADVEANLCYLRACMYDSIKRGEAPYASHGLYTQPGVLEDRDPAERKLGIEAGFAWREVAELTAVYTDLGIADGMRLGIENSKKRGIEVEFRTLMYGPAWNRSMGVYRTDLWGKK